MNYGELLLSKVIDANDPQALTRFGIDESHFITEAERKAYRFIVDYARNNRNTSPDYKSVVSEIDDFNYTPTVDSYEYLTSKLKAYSAKVEIMELLQNDAPDKFSELEGNKFIEWLQNETQSIKMRTDVRNKIGTDVKKDTDKFLEEYRARKEGTSFKIWKSKFPSINEQVGGYLSGNLYTWYGRSGRGKSIFTMEEAIEAAFQGANVLVWAMEMSFFEWMARAYSSISAREGVATATIDNVDYEAGFANKELLMGRLTEDFEAGFETFLSTVNDIIPGNIILRAVDDTDFYERGVKQLEADILQTKADVVVVDPIYYMTYEANTSKTAGGDVANTSKKLRHIAGYTKSVIHVITQAEEVKDDTDEEGNRELRAPKRAEIKKTKAVLEDASNTFGIDSVDGRGVIEIGKGRNGGEGTRVEVLYLPNYGIVREMSKGEVAVEQFTETF